MRYLKPMPCLAFAALLAGCADEPLTPAEDMLTPSFGATHEQYVWTFPNDIPGVYDECANGGQGELVDYYGAFDVVIRRVMTPSGNDAWKWFIDYFAHPLGITGQESADDWKLYKANDTGAAIKLHCDPSPCPGAPPDPTGEKLNFHWRATEWYANQHGERLHYISAGHVVMEGAEIVKHERSVLKCKYFPAG